MKWLNKQGFTLIELSVVFALFLLLTVLVQINTNFLDRMIVHTEIEKLYVICRYLQQCALVSNKEQELIFDQDHKNYRYHNNTETLPAHVFFGFKFGVKGSPASETTMINQAITFIHNRIIFYPTGIISSGTVYLTDRKKQIMYALSNGVSQISFLRTYRYNGSWQLLQ
ncbi:MAG: prepilin-type N-terminal cleavage/methylation domain-containing protein [Candidatus Babeliales bacterium]